MGRHRKWSDQDVYDLCLWHQQRQRLGGRKKMAGKLGISESRLSALLAWGLLHFEEIKCRVMQGKSARKQQDSELQ